MSPRRTVLRIAGATALLGFVVGVVVAAVELSSRTWVREFQAGAESPLAERALAIVQRAAFEGLGFGAIGLVCALLGAALAALPSRPARTAAAPSPARRVCAQTLLVAAAFAAWTWGTWVTDAALPFLQPRGLLLLNVAAFAAAVAGLWVFAHLCSRVPGAPRDEPAAAVLGALLALGAAGAASSEILLSVSRGYASLGRWALVAVCLGAALPLGALVGRLLRAPAAALAARLARGPLVPRAVATAGYAALAACALVTAATLELSAVPVASDYAVLEPAVDPPAGPDAPNVVLVTIDTLRADHLGCYGYDRPTSPFLDSLAEAGTRFADAAAPAAWTKPSTGTILTGLFPSRHGALYHGSVLQLPEGERTLAEAFRDHGYVTAGFVSNPNVKRVFAFDRGFDEFFDSPVEDTVTLAAIRDSLFGAVVMRLSRHQFNWKYENDIVQMNRHVASWLEHNHERPFFLYVHYIDPHIPYSPPAEYVRQFARDHGFPLFNERKRLVGIDLYDGEIRYTDDGLRALVGELERHGIRDETLLVFTSDHGEEFFEHEILGHGFSLYQPVVHVPFIAHGPGVVPGRVVEEPVQVVDLPATLLDLAGTGETALGDGRSVARAVRDPDWDPTRDFYLENEFGQNESAQRSFVLNAVRSGRWKVILTERNLYRPPWDPRYGAQELYDLEADPGEERNLIHDEEHQERIEELIGRLRAHSQFLDETGFRDIPPAALSPEMEAQMRALGYLGDE